MTSAADDDAAVVVSVVRALHPPADPSHLPLVWTRVPVTTTAAPAGAAPPALLFTFDVTALCGLQFRALEHSVHVRWAEAGVELRLQINAFGGEEVHDGVRLTLFDMQSGALLADRMPAHRLVNPAEQPREPLLHRRASLWMAVAPRENAVLAGVRGDCGRRTALWCAAPVQPVPLQAPAHVDVALYGHATRPTRNSAFGGAGGEQDAGVRFSVAVAPSPVLHSRAVPLAHHHHHHQQHVVGAATAAPLQDVIVVRHGDRWDDFEPGWVLRAPARHDPPISPIGHQQAAQAGAAVAAIVRGRPVRVLCSPYLRTMQTAEHIAAALSVPVCVEDGLAEARHTHVAHHSQREQRFLNLDTAYRPRVSVRSGEDYPEAMMERCATTLRAVLGDLGAGGHECIVLVTHAAPAIALAAHLRAHPERAAPERDSALGINPIGPCSFFHFQRRASDERFSLLENATFAHLSVFGNTYPWHMIDGQTVYTDD